LGDLLAEPDEHTEWLVNDRIPRGSIVLLCGKPKAGKSTAARDLAYAVATGRSWLGFACVPGTAWYLALEEKRGEVRGHFRRMGATGREPIRLFINQAPTDIVTQLQALAQQERPALIVIDTLQRFIRAADLNDYAEVTTKLDPVIRIARDSGAALVLLHHAGKADKGALDSILGSTALAGSVDNILVINRTDDYRVISSVQRIGPDLPETLILLNEETGNVHLGATKHEAEIRQVEELIIAALQNASDKPTQPELEAMVEARTQIKRESLRRLLAREQVIRSGTGLRGTPFRYHLPVPCSLVPPIGREQAIQLSLVGKNTKCSAPVSCSHVPARGQM
jgi:predicted ATP-dependent serine protease